MRISLLLSLALIGCPLGAQQIQPAQIAPGSNGQVIGTETGATQWQYPAPAQTNTAVVIASYAGGSGYASATYTLSGGTCSQQPVLKGIESGGASLPVLLSPGACTVPPNVTATGALGTGATVTLGLAGTAVTSNTLGALAATTETGSGLMVMAQNPYLVSAFLTYPVIGTSTFSPTYSAMYTECQDSFISPILVGSSGSNYETAIANGCNPSGESAIGIRPTGPISSEWVASDSVRFGPNSNQNGSLDSSMIQVNYFNQQTTGLNSISFNPSYSSTNSMPGPAGFNFFLSNGGGPVTGLGSGGGTNYTGAGTCALSGGTVLSGSATCATSLSASGGVVVTISGNAVYSVPPICTITGATGGTGIVAVSTLQIQGTETITGSLWVDTAGTLHYSTNTVGVTGYDKLTASAAGVLTVSSCTGCGTVTIGSGASPLGGVGAIASATCYTSTTAVSGALSTDAMLWSFAGNPTSTAGFQPSTSGILTVLPFVTSGNANFSICNNTSGSITPGAISLNWRIVR